MNEQSEEAGADVDPAGADPPLPWWVGHPIVKCPGLALVWGTVLAFWRLDGDAEVLVAFPLLIAVMALSIWSSVLMLRRTIPQYYLHNVSPVTVIVFSLGFIAASATALFDLAVNPPTDEIESTGGFWIAGLLFLVSILVQLGSMTDAWPDRWRPRLERPEWKTRGPS